MDFIDQNAGWLVKDEYNGEKQVSQILQTTDGGENWEATKLGDLQVNQLIFVNKTTGWAITQAAGKAEPGIETSTVQIQRTDDGGKTWNTQWEDKISLSGGFDLWFADETHGYALISGTLLSTSDGGNKWSPVSFGVNAFSPQHIIFVSADTGWVIGTINSNENSTKNELLVLQTTDGGQHWQQQLKKDYPTRVRSIDIDFVNETTGWFLTSDLDTWTGELYYTSNAGHDWQKINEIKSVRPTPTELHFNSPQAGWIPLDVGAGPISGGLLYTEDGGKNFDLISNENSLVSVVEVDFTSAQHGWAVGTDPGHGAYCGDYLMHTVDGGKTWTQVFPEIGPAEDISFLDNGHGFGLGQLSDHGALLYTADGGDTWQNIYSFSEKIRPSKVSFIDRKTGWVLAASINDAKPVVLKTADGGSTWTVLKGDNPQAYAWSVDYFKFFDANNGIMVTTGDQITFYRTQDGGQTWQKSERECLKGIYQFSFVSGKQDGRFIPRRAHHTM